MNSIDEVLVQVKEQLRSGSVRGLWLGCRDRSDCDELQSRLAGEDVKVELAEFLPCRFSIGMLVQDRISFTQSRWS